MLSRPEDADLLSAADAAIQVAGRVLQDRFSTDARPEGREATLAATETSGQLSLGVLRPALEAARPGARWVEDELDSGALPPGE